MIFNLFDSQERHCSHVVLMDWHLFVVSSTVSRKNSRYVIELCDSELLQFLLPFGAIDADQGGFHSRKVFTARTLRER